MAIKIKDLNEENRLEEHSLYLVKVQLFERNMEHRAILFTGFKGGGGLWQVYSNEYGSPISVEKLHSIKIIKKLNGKL